MVYAARGDLQSIMTSVMIFINSTLIPFIFGIATLFFLVNIVRYFIIDAADSYSREQAKSLALYGIIALVFISSLMGIIALVGSSIGIDDNNALCPDYLDNGCKTR